MPCDWNPSAEYKVYVGFDRGVLLKDDHKRCLKEMVKTFKDCFKHWNDSVNNCSLAEQIAWAHMVIGALSFFAWKSFTIMKKYYKEEKKSGTC